jgi:hypothetical protein
VEGEELGSNRLLENTGNRTEPHIAGRLDGLDHRADGRGKTVGIVRLSLPAHRASFRDVAPVAEFHSRRFLRCGRATRAFGETPENSGD